jgi:hypothetical protein
MQILTLKHEKPSTLELHFWFLLVAAAAAHISWSINDRFFGKSRRIPF